MNSSPELTVDVITTRITTTEECDSRIDSRLKQMCQNTGRQVQHVTMKPINGDCVSLGYGTLTQLRSILAYDIPVLVSPYPEEISLLERCGFEVHRLMWLFQFSPSSLFGLVRSMISRPPNHIYYVNHFTEIGMTVIGGRYYSNQHIPAVPTLLLISGSDSCGGAGQQADIKTATEFGVFTASCITAVTVQDTQGVKKVDMVPIDTVQGQLEAVCGDMELGAVKIGMTGTREVIDTIADTLQRKHLRNVVLDPVMAASR